MSEANGSATVAPHKRVRAVQTLHNYHLAMEAKASLDAINSTIYMLSEKARTALEEQMGKSLPPSTDDPIGYCIDFFFSGVLPGADAIDKALTDSRDRRLLLKEIERCTSENWEIITRDPTLHAAATALQLAKQAELQRGEFNRLMYRIAPNLCQLVGTMVAARFLRKAGSMVRLAFWPASTLQLLGSERAYRRAIGQGSNPPKHGSIIYSCPAVQFAPEKRSGQMARFLADKCAQAARVDYFPGEDIGLYGRELHERVMEKLAKYKGYTIANEIENWDKDIRATMAELRQTSQNLDQGNPKSADAAQEELEEIGAQS